MIVGGGAHQVCLLEAAKRSNLSIVLCDMTRNCSGINYADVFYEVSIMDYDSLLEVAKKEHVDGVVTNSEPAMPIVTRISQELGLVGNNCDSINTLISKSRFRDLQKQVGVFSPAHFVASSLTEVLQRLSELSYPVIIKPCESSGSRGVRKIESFDEKLIEKVFSECQNHSRNDMVVVEEYVEMTSLTTIEGDVFIYDGEILWDGLFNTTRASWAPMVPMTYSGPLFIEEKRIGIIKDTLSKLFKSSGVQYGEYNIEGFFNEDDEFFVVEINVRQGGNEIPMLIQDYSSVDLCKLLVSTSVGDSTYWDYLKNHKRQCRYAAKQITYSAESGKYAGLFIDESVAKYVTRTYEYVKVGDTVEKCVDATSHVAIVDLVFPTFEEQITYYDKITDLVRVKVY